MQSTAPFRSLMTAYAKTVNADPQDLLWSYQGRALPPERTPSDLGMQDSKQEASSF